MNAPAAKAISGTAFATLTLANNLLGLAPGPWVTGLLADRTLTAPAGAGASQRARTQRWHEPDSPRHPPQAL